LIWAVVRSREKYQKRTVVFEKFKNSKSKKIKENLLKQ
jgi:hypothetical protein